MATFDEYTDVYSILPEQISCIWETIFQIIVMQLVGLPPVPQDACPEIKPFQNTFHIKWWTGAVRDVIEQVMKVQGKWMKALMENTINQS